MAAGLTEHIWTVEELLTTLPLPRFSNAKKEDFLVLYPNDAVLLWEAKEGLPHWVKVEVLHLGAFGVPILPALPVLV